MHPRGGTDLLPGVVPLFRRPIILTWLPSLSLHNKTRSRLHHHQAAAPLSLGYHHQHLPNLRRMEPDGSCPVPCCRGGGKARPHTLILCYHGGSQIWRVAAIEQISPSLPHRSMSMPSTLCVYDMLCAWRHPIRLHHRCCAASLGTPDPLLLHLFYLPGH